MIKVEDCTFIGIYEDRRKQIFNVGVGQFTVTERDYFPLPFSTAPVTTFYSFWVGDKPVEFKNGKVAEDPYSENSYFIVFTELEEMVEFLNFWEGESHHA
jgi:hypothetical protein